jgi:hypothetical protein
MGAAPAGVQKTHSAPKAKAWTKVFFMIASFTIQQTVPMTVI